jgi:hypothetical protein
MKPLLHWCAVFFGVYASMSAAYHIFLSQHPRRVVVAIDTSFPMQAVWSQVPDTLTALQARRYPDITLADQVYVITNATDRTALPADVPWRLLALQPLAP